MYYKFCFPCKIKGDDKDIFCKKCGELLTRVDDLPLTSNEPSEEKLKIRRLYQKYESERLIKEKSKK